MVTLVIQKFWDMYICPDLVRNLCGSGKYLIDSASAIGHYALHLRTVNSTTCHVCIPHEGKVIHH